MPRGGFRQGLGRKPMPTALKIVNGTAKLDPSSINPNEPTPPVGAKRPPWLSPAARRHWPKIAPMLEEIGVLTIADAHALGLFCEAFARWREAESKLDNADRLVVLTSTGELKVSPYVTISKLAFDEMTKMLVEFGLTPSSRTRVSRVISRGFEKPTTGLASFRKKA